MIRMLVWIVKSATPLPFDVAGDEVVAALVVGAQLAGDAAERGRPDEGEGIVGAAGDGVDGAEIDLVVAADEIEDPIGAADFGEGEDVVPARRRSTVVAGAAVEQVLRRCRPLRVSLPAPPFSVSSCCRR